MKLILEVIWLFPAILGGNPEIVGTYTIGVFYTVESCEAQIEILQMKEPPDYWFDHYAPEFAGPRKYALHCEVEALS